MNIQALGGCQRRAWGQAPLGAASNSCALSCDCLLNQGRHVKPRVKVQSGCAKSSGVCECMHHPALVDTMKDRQKATSQVPPPGVGGEEV